MTKESEQLIKLLHGDQKKYSSMLSKTTHDLNNSLAVFLGQVSILELLNKKDSLTPEKIESIIEKLNKSIDKFKIKLNDLKSYYKVPLDDEDYEKASDILKATEYFYANQVYNQEIEFELEIDNSVEEDKAPSQSSTILLALKIYFQESLDALNGQEQGKMKLSLKKQSGKLQISLQDNRTDLTSTLNPLLEQMKDSLSSEMKGIIESGAKSSDAFSHETSISF